MILQKKVIYHTDVHGRSYRTEIQLYIYILAIRKSIYISTSVTQIYSTFTYTICILTHLPMQSVM